MRANKQLATFRKYDKSSKTVLGFEFNNMLYISILDKIPSRYLIIARLSSKNGGGKKIQIHLTNKHKQELVNKYNATPVMAMDLFENVQGYNNGDKLENLLRCLWGLTHKHDNLPFYKGSDLVVNGVGYSIKYQNAQLCTYKTCNRLAQQEPTSTKTIIYIEV